MTYTHILALLCLALYGLSSVLYLIAILRQQPVALPKLARITLIAGFIAHTSILYSFVQTQGAIIPSQRGEYLFWLAWLLPFISLVFRAGFESPILGAFMAPAATLFFAGSSYLLHTETATYNSEGNDVILLMHVLPALLAELSLVIVFIGSAGFMVQERRIRKKSSSLISSGPSLEGLDRLTRRFVLTGFLAMGFAVLSGAMWAVMQRYTLLGADYFQWSAILAWVVLAMLLYFRNQLHWSPQRMSRISFALASIFIASFVLIGLAVGNEMHVKLRPPASTAGGVGA